MSSPVSPIVKVVAAAVLIVVVGVFIGITLCATLHPPVESFSSCARTTVDGSDDTKKKCIRIVSRPPPKLPAPTIVIAPAPHASSTDLQNTQDRKETCAKDKPGPPSTCPKTVYCPPCPKCPAPCPRMCPDMSKYVLKTSIPPCPVAEVDRDVYIPKSECKKPDMSKYVLKSKMHSFKKPPCPPCVCDDKRQTKNADTTTIESPNTSQKQVSKKTNAQKSSSNAESSSDTKPKQQRNPDLFGENGVLGDENMVAWNDMGIGGAGFGASVKESTTFTDSCAK